MAKDPNGTLNVIAQHPQVAVEMKRLIEALLQEVDRKAAGFQKRDGIDPELERQLKGLGYRRGSIGSATGALRIRFLITSLPRSVPQVA